MEITDNPRAQTADDMNPTNRLSPITAFSEMLGEAIRNVQRLRANHDALLVALKQLAAVTAYLIADAPLPGILSSEALADARAAIARAEAVE